MKWNVIAAAIIVALVFASWSSYAQRQPSECAGVLHKDRYGLRIGGGIGEDEGICVINKAEANKVLAVCALEKFCRIIGHVDICKDSGECSQIRNIAAVRNR